MLIYNSSQKRKALSSANLSLFDTEGDHKNIRVLTCD